MGRRAKKELEITSDFSKRGKSHPAATTEERENQLINLAMDRAEQQLREGTASSQVIVHFLKLGTIRNEIELEKMRRENELLSAKTSAIESSEKLQSLYTDAIKAMQKYRGSNEE